ncbi:MAG: indoleamine 2,3-dioxygenase [Alphaproteobacteria bacterium]|nr:indoleamine 2,3-dioxygenase [Alphaproteobacteria bacterium]MCD8520353.1 indoleamine 2,3-dioxygenase [Alphaproteobacteria bacterium]MCD8526113.1 indoleamine 2,3-dioxygenase [Alphaproteobacteria bacterium]MCD8570478.1 indoleamine 2,3-dioxygenase [Alphaproteobacteria bacterium]
MTLRLEDFDITAERGFLTPYEMDQVTLPAAFDEILSAGKHLSDYMCSGHLRTFLDRLKQVDMKGQLPSLNHAQMCKLMIHYSFIVQAYVWGEEHPPAFLPKNLAVPYCDLADALGMFPLLPYSSYTLDNWGKLEADKPITLENIWVIQNFLDGQDENWFIMVHIEIEAKAGAALAAIPALIDAVNAGDMGNVLTGLKTIRSAWDLINPVFDRMPERCDPYVYYHRVRPYIHGWKGNPAMPDGLIYEGVDKYQGKPQPFRGQTGSQSSIVPVMDALLGISHENDPLREYLDELHQYRPPKHRLFIEAVQENSKLRDFVSASGSAELVQVYNDIVDHVQKFRTRHLEYAASYINKQARDSEGNPVDIGTGGTPFMKYLKKHRDESVSHLLPLPKGQAA